MGNRYVLHIDVGIVTEIPERLRCKIGTQICDECVRKTKPVYDVGDEVDCSVCRDLDDWLVLDPLGELVDCHHYVIESPLALWLEVQTSRLKHENSQDGGIVFRLWART